MSNLVSIIIPYFNSSKTLHRLLTSIFNQVYDNFECILIDDGSSDDSFSLVNELINGKPNYYNFRRPDHYKPGGRGSKNFGFSISKGVFIVFFDSDDRMLENYLKVRIDYLNKYINADAVISNYYWRVKDQSTSKRIFKYNESFFNQFNELIKTVFFWLNYMDYKFYFPPGNPMYRRTFIEDKQMWDESTSIGEDHEYHARLFLQGLNLGFDSSITFDYMYNENSMIATSENSSALLSRSYGKMLVLNNLIKYNISSNILIKKEIFCQIKILRRINNCYSNQNEKKNANQLVLERINSLYSLLRYSKLKICINLSILKIITKINLHFNFGYKLYTTFFKDSYPTHDNTFFSINEEN